MCLHSVSKHTPILPLGLFLKTVAYGALTLFLFGYHVHEKAILVTLLPLTLLLSPSNTTTTATATTDDKTRAKHRVYSSTASQDTGRDPGVGFGASRERELWHAVYLQVAAGGVTALLPLLMHVEELALKGE